MSDPAQQLGFLLDEFRRQVPHVLHVVAVSADGLLVAADALLHRDAADRLAAVASGLVSLLRNGGVGFSAGALSHNMTEYADGFMFTMAAPNGACLLLFADRDCDLGTVSFELTTLVNRLGDAIVPAARVLSPTH